MLLKQSKKRHIVIQHIANSKINANVWICTNSIIWYFTVVSEVKLSYLMCLDKTCIKTVCWMQMFNKTNLNLKLYDCDIMHNDRNDWSKMLNDHVWIQKLVKWWKCWQSLARCNKFGVNIRCKIDTQMFHENVWWLKIWMVWLIIKQRSWLVISTLSDFSNHNDLIWSIQSCWW